MTRLGSYLSPDHYKSRYNLYAGDMESPPLPSADFMQPKICFMDIWVLVEGKKEKFNMNTHVLVLSLFLLIDQHKTGITK